MALDVTSRCNLRCLHCYWWKEAHPKELDSEEMIALMKRLRATGLRAALLYGGEPTLRPEVCRAADEIFDSLLIFTNGTNGFPRLHRGQWILSLDGPREINDKIRGPGVFDQALEGLQKAHRPPLVHITLSSLNAHSLEEFVRVMMDLPIKGMGFSFYTPISDRGWRTGDPPEAEGSHGEDACGLEGKIWGEGRVYAGHGPPTLEHGGIRGMESVFLLSGQRTGALLSGRWKPKAVHVRR